MADISKIRTENVTYNIKDSFSRELLSDTTNPIYYGADPTGQTDSTTAFNSCVQANKGGTINLTTGTYLLTGVINMPFKNADKVNINGNGSKIIVSGNISNLFYYGADREGSERNDVGWHNYIKDLFIECEGGTVSTAILINDGFKDLKILNCKIYRAQNAVRIGVSGGTPADTLINECIFYGKGSEYEGSGVIINGTDVDIDNTRIYGFRTGVINNGGLRANKIQVLLRWQDQTSSNFDPYERNSSTFNTYYNQTVAFETHAPLTLVNCYCDSMKTFVSAPETDANIIEVIGSVYYNARNDVDCKIFSIATNAPFLTITGCSFYITKNTSGVCIDIPTMNNYAQIKINDIIIKNIGRLTNPTDLILSSQDSYHSNVSCTANTWYVVGCVLNVASYTRYLIDVLINGVPYTINIQPILGDTITYSYTQYNKTSTDSNITLGFLMVDDVLYVCAKFSSTTSTKLDMKVVSGTNLYFQCAPLHNSNLVTTSRLLSDFTNLTPSETHVLKTTE